MTICNAGVSKAELKRRSPRDAGATNGALFLPLLLLLFVTAHLNASTLQNQIDAAKAGQIIHVKAGDYHGNIIIRTPITLEGIGRPVLHGSRNGSVVTLLADHCTIRGFRIAGSGGELQDEDSGILAKSNFNVIENNEISDTLYGIYLFHSEGSLVRNNQIRGRPELDQGERGSGIHIWNSSNNRIERNAITQARDGLFIQDSSDNLILGNNISDLRYGVHYMFSDRNHFESNLFTNNVAGAAVMYSDDITFRRNLFLHNRGFSSFGILLQECHSCVAEENWIIDNVTGIFMEGVRNSEFRRNVVAENDTALEIFSSSAENTIAENNFVDNLSPVQLVGNETTTRWQVSGKGNFWSDYDGYDLDENGIGDVQHSVQNIFEYMEGNHPRLRLYLYSPASTAIASAEKAFPVLIGSKEIDRAPLMRAVSVSLPSNIHPETKQTNVPLGFLYTAFSWIAALIVWRAQK